MGKEQEPAEGNEDKKSVDGRKVRTHLGMVRRICRSSQGTNGKSGTNGCYSVLTLIESQPSESNYTAPRETCPQTQKGAGFHRRLCSLPKNNLFLYRSALQLLALFFEHRAAAEFDFVAFERQALDQNLVAFLQLVADVLDAVLGDLADVQQAVGSREDFHEGPEIHQPHHFAEIGLADFGGGSEVADDLDGLVGAGFIGAGHVNRAIVFDVDLDAGLFDDAANDFAAWSDDVANLIGRNVQRVNSRCV